MAADPRRSVVAPSGEMHGVPGLYVADASLFPTAVKVNPMALMSSSVARFTPITSTKSSSSSRASGGHGKRRIQLWDSVMRMSARGFVPEAALATAQSVAV